MSGASSEISRSLSVAPAKRAAGFLEHRVKIREKTRQISGQKNLIDKSDKNSYKVPNLGQFTFLKHHILIL
jgi:hypothetical protein